MRQIIFFLIITFYLSISSGQDVSESPNWCQEAENSLTSKDGLHISCDEIKKNHPKSLRCIQMNNYFCQKHTENGGIVDPWKGTPQSNGKDGLADSAGHAIFESSEWSFRAIARDIRSKYLSGKVTAFDISEAYSPWCDTIGSYAVNKEGYGRTCSDGKKPSKNVKKFCVRPQKSNPTKSDCLPGCNCPPEVAHTLVQGLQNHDINSDLMLFDKNNKNPDAAKLAVIIRNLARQEQGIYVKPEMVKHGIELLSQ